jgi:hypothetical protein
MRLENEEVDYIRGLTRGTNDFDCLTRPLQIEHFANFLVGRGRYSFSVEEIRELFSVASLTSPRSGKPVSPSPSEITDALDRLVAKGELALIRDGETYRSPWRALYMSWRINLNGSPDKFESICRRLMSTARRHPERAQLVDRSPPLVAFDVHLLALGRTPAVGEAWQIAMATATRWNVFTREGIVVAESERLPLPAIARAQWSIAEGD